MVVTINKKGKIISGKRADSYSSSSLGSDYETLKREYPSVENAFARVIDLNKRRKLK
jgi:hypothetical protein